MLSPLVFLPAISVLAWSVFFSMAGSDEDGPGDWTRAFLIASVLTGVVFSVSTELLSAFHLLARGPVLVIWATTSVAAIVLNVRRRAWAAAAGRLRASARLLRNGKPIEVLGTVALGLPVLVLLVIAWVSPPNTADAMQYHMPRLVHWIQDRSLAPYATAFEPQIYNPIWAEVVGVHLRLLAGGESSANLLQWGSWVGSMILAAGLARQLGASTWGARIGAAYFASVPVALLQATSAKNDLAVGFWTLALASYAVLAWGRGLRRVEWLAAGLTAGLGVLTKGTFLPFALPALGALMVAAVRESGVAAKILAALGAVAGVALNAPHWGRNLLVYGSPIGPTASVVEKIGITLDPIAIGLQLLSNLAQNFVVPWSAFRHAVESVVVGLYQLFGRDPGGFHLAELWNHEDQAGNPFHILLGLAGIAVLLRAGRPTARLFAVLALGSMVVFSATVKFDVYGVRYQVPFFALCAAAVGSVASDFLRPSIRRWGVLALIVAGLPWVVLNRTRPLIGWIPRTSVASVFVASRWELIFANWQERRLPTQSSVEAVLGLMCREVGLRIDSHDWEYPFWSGLAAPESGLRLAVLNPGPELRPFQDAAFRPCAIVCTICGGRERLHGLARSGEWGDVVLYAGGTFHADPDG